MIILRYSTQDNTRSKKRRAEHERRALLTEETAVALEKLLGRSIQVQGCDGFTTANFAGVLIPFADASALIERITKLATFGKLEPIGFSNEKTTTRSTRQRNDSAERKRRTLTHQTGSVTETRLQGSEGKVDFPAATEVAANSKRPERRTGTSARRAGRRHIKRKK